MIERKECPLKLMCSEPLQRREVCPVKDALKADYLSEPVKRKIERMVDVYVGWANEMKGAEHY